MPDPVMVLLIIFFPVWVSLLIGIIFFIIQIFWMIWVYPICNIFNSKNITDDFLEDIESFLKRRKDNAIIRRRENES